MSSNRDVIVLNDDDELNDALETITLYSDNEDEDQAPTTMRGLPATHVLALDDENIETIDLTGDDFVYIRELSPGQIQAAYGLENYRLIDRAVTQFGLVVKASTAQQPFHVDLVNGDFLRPAFVWQHIYNGKVVVQGLSLVRTRRVQHFFKRNRNELCAILRQEYCDGEMETTDLDSCLVTVSIDDIVQAREVVYTNKDFPQESFRFDPHYFGASGSVIEDTAVLVCRWKYIERYNPTTRKVVEEVIMGLSKDEADRGKSIPDLVKKNIWRENACSSNESSPSTAYRYGDIGAGGGGTTRAAVQQGFNIKFLLDQWPVACSTLRQNFPLAKVLEFTINHFCVKLRCKRYMLVDVLHISFPCQAFAKCNTRGGQNDEDNEATQFSVEHLFLKCRPRVVTFEQTWGILDVDHRPHFEALIHNITCMGYNVRWKVIFCHELGNVQPRKRLFIIASCPGEPLPPFPKKTHGPGLRRFVTIKDRLALLPHRIPARMAQFTPKNSAPYDANQILKSAITCNGGEGDKHPDGGRSFNLQELALLQGFPVGHIFEGTKTDIRKQIGNAVPCMVAKAIFAEIEKSLRKQDQKERVRVGGAQNPLTID